MSSHQQSIICSGNDVFGLELRRLVLETFGYRARVIPECSAASAALSAERVDLVVLDFSDMSDGLEECIRLLRAENPTQRILLIAPVPYLEPSISSLVDRVLLKGISPEEFREAVQSCIRGMPRRRALVRLASFIGACFGVMKVLLQRRQKNRSAAATNQPTALGTSSLPNRGCAQSNGC